MEITAETIRDYLPYYLTEDEKRGIVNELNQFQRLIPLSQVGQYVV